MVTKDWKRKYKAHAYAEWNKKDYSKFVTLRKIEVGFNQLKPLWKVNLNNEKDKTFKTKKQALSFARSYMRKH